MAKTSTTTTTTTANTLQSDRDLINKLKRVTRPIQSEMDEIEYIYKKYIDPNAGHFCRTCNSSPNNSIQRAYWKVIALSI
jgi:hypothetical protein